MLVVGRPVVHTAGKLLDLTSLEVSPCDGENPPRELSRVSGGWAVDGTLHPVRQTRGADGRRPSTTGADLGPRSPAQALPGPSRSARRAPCAARRPVRGGAGRRHDAGATAGRRRARHHVRRGRHGVSPAGHRRRSRRRAAPAVPGLRACRAAAAGGGRCRAADAGRGRRAGARGRRRRRTARGRCVPGFGRPHRVDGDPRGAGGVDRRRAGRPGGGAEQHRQPPLVLPVRVGLGAALGAAHALGGAGRSPGAAPGGHERPARRPPAAAGRRPGVGAGTPARRSLRPGPRRRVGRAVRPHRPRRGHAGDGGRPARTVRAGPLVRVLRRRAGPAGHTGGGWFRRPHRARSSWSSPLSSRPPPGVPPW